MFLLDVSDLDKLSKVDCSGNVWGWTEFGNYRAAERMEELNTEGCDNIQRLDIDLNMLDDLDFSHLNKLESISARQNNLVQVRQHIDNEKEQVSDFVIDFPKFKKELILNSSYLTLIDVKLSDVKEIINKGIVWDPLNPQSFLATLNNPKQFRIIDNSTDEANWHPDAPTLWEQIVIEQEQQKLREELALDEFSTQSENDQTIITDISQLTNNYPNFCEKNKNQSFLDISHMNLMKNLIIDDWPNLRELNVGNNFLSYLVVKNCPQLTTLRYAHNAMRHDAFIENCDNLTTIDKEKYHDSSWDKDLEELFKKDELKPQIDNNPQPSQSEQEPTEEEETPPSVPKITSPKQNYWPVIIIGLILIFPITLVIFVLLAKKWINNYLQKRASLFKKKKNTSSQKTLWFYTLKKYLNPCWNKFPVERHYLE
ncbi:MAG: hypothetical protein GBAus27B_000549 [Mycoplasmataceae bacterium]|nr:MAG: hypothetical protein GBAus27B_000549 [Mycoplasmataceae bacterium]